MIGVLDYGMGNLFSVSAALDRLDTPHIVSSAHEKLRETDGLILPGVGSFRDAMFALKKQDHQSFIYDYIKSKPLFGICLGMQLLFEQSEENGPCEGLSLLPGEIKRFTGIEDVSGNRYKVPHMGWNRLTFHKPESVLLKNNHEDYVYFVHSYKAYLKDANVLTASADYFGQVPAVVEKDLIFGAQFHPEKSGTLGMNMLRNFVAFTRKEDEGV